MATQKDFRIKNGLIVQNGNTTVDQGTVSIADQISGDTGQLIITNGQSGSSFMRIGIIGSGTANSHIRTDSTLEFHIGQSATSSTPSVSINTSGNIQVSGNVNASLVGANNIDGLVLQLNGTTVVNSSRNIVNVGTISNSAFTIPNSIGTAGQVLKVPSSGTTLEWGNSSSVVTGITNFADNRLLTASGSTTINGESNLTFNGSALNVVGDITLGDNKNIYIGTSNELQLVHNGNDSIIKHTISTGELKLGSSGTGITFYNPSNGDIYAEFNAGADVTLYHNDQPKLATTSSGINVTGQGKFTDLTNGGLVHARGLDASLWLDITSGNNAKIYYDSGDLEFKATNPTAVDSSVSMKIAQNRDISFYEDTGTTAKFFWDASTERLGIGTTSPDKALTISASDSQIRLYDADGTNQFASFQSDNGIAKITSRNNTSHGQIAFQRYNGTVVNESMRLDSSGNLLVGKTTTSNATAGAELNASGQIVGTFASGTHILGRNTNDGSILEFQKDGGTVGSIGTRATYLTVGTGDIGLLFNSGSNRIQPENITTGAVTDNLVDLGYSGGRFKDLYLSGTISSGAITSSGASSGRYTGLEVVNTTNAGGTETAIGLGVVAAGNNACDVKLVANRVGANSGSDFYIEQTDASGNQDETFRITEDGNATFLGTISSRAITATANSNAILMQTSSNPSSYYAYISANYSYAQAFSIKAKGAGSEYTLMDWGDGVGLEFHGGSTQNIKFSNHNLSSIGTISSLVNANRFLKYRSGSIADFEVSSDNNSNAVMTVTGTGTADIFKVRDNTNDVFTIADGGNSTFAGNLFAKNVVFVGGNSYNENIRMHPSSNDYSSLVLGAVSGNSGTGTGQWTLVRYPTATYSNKFTIRHNSTDFLTINTSGNTTFAGTISSGAITSSASITASGNSNNFGNTTIAALSATSGTFSASVTASGNSNSFGNSSFGTISSGAITSTGNSTFSGVIGVGGTLTNSSFGVYLQNNKWYATQYSSSHDVVRMNANTAGGLDIYNQTDNGFANVRVGSLNIEGTTVIDSSRNLTNIGTISSSYFNSSANINATGVAGFTVGGGRIGFDQSGTRSWTMGVGSGYLNVFSGDGNGDLNLANNIGLRQNGTTVIDSSRSVLANNYYYLNSKIMAQGTDNYLRINQSNQFSSGVWFGNSNIYTATGNYIAAGSNGGTTSSRVYMYGGTYNGSNVIALDGSDGKIKGSYYAVGSTTVIDSSRNLTNIGTISATGTASSTSPTLSLTTTDSYSFNHLSNSFAPNLTGGEAAIHVIGKEGNTKNSGYYGYYWSGAGSNSNFVSIGHWGADHLFRVYADGTVRASTGRISSYGGGYDVSGTVVIDASRNLTNIGTISSGAITSSSTIKAQAHSAWNVDSGLTSYFEDDAIQLTKTASNYLVAEYGNKTYSDAIIEAEFRTTNSSHFGIFFFGQATDPNDNSYNVILRSSDTVRLQTRISGTQAYPTGLGTVNGTATGIDVDDGDWHSVKATISGTRLVVDVDGVTILDGTLPTTYTSGTVGLMLYDNTAYFRNFQVRETTAAYVIHNDFPLSTYYGSGDVYLDLHNSTGSASGTLLTADNGNTWLNADGGKDLWLNWYSKNNPGSYADLQVGDGNGGNPILFVGGSANRVGINDNTPSQSLDINGNVGIGGTQIIDSSRNLTNIGTISSGAITAPKINATATGMSEFATNMSSQDDWRNSPISIRERGLAGAGDGEDRDSPNLNFHWSARVSNSLWMNASGYLSYGSYSSTGVPSADGIFRAGAYQVGNTTVIDTSRNLNNIGTISSGAINASANSSVTGTITASGGRPIVLTPSSGMITSKGSSGGWAFGYHALGTSNTDHGGFGFLGNEDSFSYYYIGQQYNSGNNFRFYKSGELKVGTTTLLDSSKNLTNIGSISATDLLTQNNTTIASIGSRDLVTIGSGSRAGAIKINDIAGANYTIAGGGYDLTFYKNVSGTSNVGVMRFVAGSASDSTPDVSIEHNLAVGGDISIGASVVIDSSRNVTANSVLLSGLQTQVLSVSGGELLMGAVDNDDFVTNIKGFGGSTSMEFGDGTINAVGSTTINHSKSSATNPILTLKNTSTTNEGRYVQFLDNAGVNIGQIGHVDQTESNIFIATFSTGLKFESYITYKAILPCGTDGADSDNSIDLGSSSVRFDDIYATNGTIQTSDRNLKQDIQALTDAEQRVATACKGLIRRFRWQDSVAEKDNNPDSDETARYHFGVIAQDLQDAFEAEGLDASDYGMFISSTWTDDDGVEQTRLGVRYNELLSFIITTL